ncbi:MAG: replication initiation protein RepM [Candidatus Methylumidiphilus sp.]
MNNKNELVVKSNRLVEASYRLSVAEQRVVLLAIVQARETQTGLTSDSNLEIRATDYAKTFDIPENQAYEQMIDAEQTLFNRYVILHDINPKTRKEDKIKTRWVSSVTYPKGGGSIYIQFAQKIIPYIIRLETEFTPYRLEQVARMSSAYAIRMYEFLIQWGSIGKREIELAWLRKTLGLEGQYPSIKDFKKYVIDVGISQINEFSDLTASYTQRKTGRVVTHFIFTFSKKPTSKQKAKPETAVAKPPKQPLPEQPDWQGFFRLARVAIPPKTQAEYLKLRTGEEIELCIERVNEYGSEQEKAGKPVRYGAIYRKAIEEGWHEEKARQKAQQAEDTARKEASRQSAAEAKRAEAEKAGRRKMETELSAAWFSALPDDDKKAMGSAFLAESLAASNSFDIGNFKRKGYTYVGFQFFVSRKWRELNQQK